MKKFKFIFTILIILFKTGNVLSDSSIFTVNNILVNKNAYKNKEELINIAFLRGFKKLNNKILLEKDLNKINDENLKNIKNLISHYQILDNNKSSEKGDTIVNIFLREIKFITIIIKTILNIAI